MKNVLRLIPIFVTAGLLLLAFPFFSVAVSAPDQVVLVLTKSAFPEPVVAGEVLTYTVSVVNSGDELATGLVLSDTLPDGVSFKAASQECTHVAHEVSCELGDLEADASTWVTITVDVDPSARGSITNVASASSNESGPTVPIDEVTPIEAVAVLGIQKGDGVSTVTAGGAATYTYAITVTNAGPSLATGMVITDTWQGDFTWLDVIPSHGNCITSATEFICDVGSVAAGGQETITASYSVPAGTPLEQQTNTARASAVEASAPVADSDTNIVLTPTDLGMDKSDGVTEVVAGDPEGQAYIVTLTNSGPSRSRGVTVTDAWPNAFTRGTVITTRGSCSNTATGFTCDVGTMQVGDQVTITAPYNVPPGTPAGTYTNTAVMTDEEGSPPATASDETSVVIRADVRLLSKTDSPDPVISGEILTYNLVVTNAGPSNASAVVLTDNLPAGTEYEDSLSSPACNGPATGPVICALGTMTFGSTRNLTIRALVTRTTAGTINNTASVTAATTDLDLTNNEKQQSTTVQIDLGVPVVSWMLPVPDLGYYDVNCKPVCPIVDLQANASDDLGVQRVDFFRYDHFLIEYFEIGSDFTAPYTWELDTDVLPIGINQIFAQAYDLVDKPSVRKRIFLDKPRVIFMPLVRR